MFCARWYVWLFVINPLKPTTKTLFFPFSLPPSWASTKDSQQKSVRHLRQSVDLSAPAWIGITGTLRSRVCSHIPHESISAARFVFVLALACLRAHEIGYSIDSGSQMAWLRHSAHLEPWCSTIAWCLSTPWYSLASRCLFARKCLFLLDWLTEETQTILLQHGNFCSLMVVLLYSLTLSSLPQETHEIIPFARQEKSQFDGFRQMSWIFFSGLSNWASKRMNDLVLIHLKWFDSMRIVQWWQCSVTAIEHAQNRFHQWQKRFKCKWKITPIKSHVASMSSLNDFLCVSDSMSFSTREK